MKSTIKLTDTETGIIIAEGSYDTEECGQGIYDLFIEEDWFDKTDRYSVRLIAHDPEAGDQVRRTMYSNINPLATYEN